MRNRYLISIATALVAVLLVGATGCKGNPEKAKKKYLESGLSYVDKKQYDAAVIQFKKALQVDPKYAEAHYQLGLTYLRQQHVKEGYFELRQAGRARSQEPESPAGIGQSSVVGEGIQAGGRRGPQGH